MGLRCIYTLFVAGITVGYLSANAEIDFESEIKPIFEQNCYECHSGSNSSGGFLIDKKMSAFHGGKSGSVIQAESPESSALIKVLNGTHETIPVMPFGRDPLPQEEIERIALWIKQGADWPDSADIKQHPGLNHWAYQKPVRPDVPQVENQNKVANPIDSFLLEKLEEQGLSYSEPATKEQLIRRLALDITGMLPAIQEVEQFLQSNDSLAYQNLLNEFFESPHYGEHQARYWLDLARYADSHGYQVDRPRSMWPYRDWVIDAFNSNMPFDQFSIEQLAGDLLSEPSKEQLIATGFHRNTKVNEEGGVDPEEFRRMAVVDRVDTTTTVWLGSTMACAECHDHKYDPISQKEFYEMYAYFNNTKDRGNHGGLKPQVPPVLYLPDETLEKELQSIQNRIDQAKANLKSAEANIDFEMNSWEKRWHRDQPSSWIDIGPVEYSSEREVDIELLEDNSLFFDASEFSLEPDTYTIMMESPKVTVHAVRIEVMPDERLPQGGTGHSQDGNFAISEVRVYEALRKDRVETNQLKLKSAWAEYSQEKYEANHVIDDNPDTAWSVFPRVDEKYNLVLELENPLSFHVGQNLLVEIDQNEGFNHQVGRLRITVSMEPKNQRVPLIPFHTKNVLSIKPENRTDEHWQLLRDFYTEISPTIDILNQTISRLEQQKEETYLMADSTMIMGELEEPRETRVHIRGNFLDPGEVVQPTVPAVFHEMPDDLPNNRLGLARWLMSRENPLVARVTVNRLWQQIFGTGLVKTSEDFGTQGEYPSHPELLDWLAVEFKDSGWDVQHMIRLLVTSNAYKQSSKTTAILREVDPENRLLARGPRFRMDAEMIRDSVLQVSGLLNSEIGGPSVFPEQPHGIWKEIGFLRPEFGMSRWPTSEGEDRFRRGIYTFWRRTITYPSFVAFDAPSRETCTVKRPRTNTPLQALATLNDPVYMEAAQALAYRLLSADKKSDDDKIKYAYKLGFSREPSSKELNRMLDLLEQQRDNYTADPQLCDELMIPYLKERFGNEFDQTEVAAWTIVGNVLFNLDEFITKG